MKTSFNSLIKVGFFIDCTNTFLTFKRILPRQFRQKATAEWNITMKNILQTRRIEVEKK